MSKPEIADAAESLNTAVADILGSISQEREREIISRRFGLEDRKETLEQIGEMLGITRERVRQLEKAILTKLRASVADDKLPSVNSAEKLVVSHLSEMGRGARMQNLTSHILGRDATLLERSAVAFLAELAPGLTVINENDDFYQSAVISSVGDEKSVKKQVEEIVKFIKKHGQPITAEAIHESMDYEHPQNIAALASISKKLAELKGNWGLIKWPTVNPKNIRDKIFVILDDNGKPMHFSEIAKAIKDSRFVLIGRGIYALDSWGYSRGTVADIITDILKEADEPLHRDEIIKRVLDKRQVKETTILLNLQSKSQFKRVAKATYVFEQQQA